MRDILRSPRFMRSEKEVVKNMRIPRFVRSTMSKKLHQ